MGKFPWEFPLALVTFPFLDWLHDLLKVVLPVFVFTSLLFLSGYVLQQQTVRNLQAAIKPLHPPQTPTLDKSLLVSKHNGSLQGHSSDNKLLTSKKPKGGWAKAAYVQILRDRTEACTAVMLFAELERQDSMAQRIIIYPEEWHLERGKRVDSSSPVRTSLRLLENAARSYKVLLQPISKLHNFPEGMS